MFSFGTQVFKNEVNKLKASSWKRDLEKMKTEEKWKELGLFILNLWKKKKYYKKKYTYFSKKIKN